MHKKLIALASAGLLLAGCSASNGQDSSESPAQTPDPAVTQSSMWDSMDFCASFREWRTDYQDALDAPGDKTVTDLATFKKWSDALRSKAPDDVAEEVATFTEPIYMTESATVNLVELFSAGNGIEVHCIQAG